MWRPVCGLVESGGSNILEFVKIISNILESVEIVIRQHLNYKERSFESLETMIKIFITMVVMIREKNDKREESHLVGEDRHSLDVLLHGDLLPKPPPRKYLAHNLKQ